MADKDDDFYGVGSEYKNYANETDKPRWSDEEKKALGLTEKDTDEKKDDEKEEPKAPATPASTPKLPGK